MALVFIDTEFTDLKADALLISLALVSEEGSTFYVELNDHWHEHQCSEFVRENVLPQLNLAEDGMSLSEAALALRSFVESLDGHVEVASDAPVWDSMMLDQLFSASGVPWPGRLQRKFKHVGHLRDDLPDSLFPHHALEDARQLALAWARG
ncbi:3'-5' exoribonuclease domain-containing protein [Atopomonas sediminilitoris]|uniref:3'-5' exoribonuclease domain-containing protein n=1 Tax=Atopomonas sediminilitoris TaxID=2919919 RepID=UPI001F4D8EDB|nr:3'-5' exoribonuclease [Atopomonas sediminilitoris]MCJ8169354.1 3'-5' exoribonuclease [Atopomonas sediminilitoris]